MGHAGRPFGAVLVVLLGGLGGLSGGCGLLDDDADGKAAARSSPIAATPSPTPTPVKLRAITGDQLCDAIPVKLRRSMVADTRIGGKRAGTGASSSSEKSAFCEWTNSRMAVGGGVTGYRKLVVSVEAKSTKEMDLVAYAKWRYDSEKKTGERQGELFPMKLGDASYGRLDTQGSGGIEATVSVLMGPWVIEVAYGGNNRTSGRPAGGPVRAKAEQVAELITTEMGKGAGDVEVTGPCATLAAKDVEAAFFPEASGPSASGSEGAVKQQRCGWQIKEPVDHAPGQPYTARGGELGIAVADYKGTRFTADYHFERLGKQYDRWRAKGGIGNSRVKTTYEPRTRVPGLGDEAFAVVSTRTPQYKSTNSRPAQEILILVRAGHRTVELTYKGTTAGGGIIGSPGYKEPTFQPQVAQTALVKLAKPFISGLN